MKRIWTQLALLLVTLAASGIGGTTAAAEDRAAAAEQRLSNSVKYLASDELQGRGVGTTGLDLAADYIAAEFKKMGLDTKLFEGSPFQRFSIIVDSELGPPEKNRLAFIAPLADGGAAPVRTELQLGQDFNPLAIGGSGEFDLPLVFAGYGITARDEKYDDYAKVDVKGKAVLILRKEPQQDNAHSIFNGDKNTQYAFFNSKISNAYEHGAAAVILVNDNFSLSQQAQANEKSWQATVDKLLEAERAFRGKGAATPDQVALHRAEITKLAKRIQELGEQLDGDVDKVLDFQGAGTGSGRTMPVLFVSRKAVDPLITRTFGVDLATLEQRIDKDLVPRSGELMGWRLQGAASIIQKQAEVKNVVGVLEGAGPLADETIIIGAHYDHLGLGGPGSLAPWTSEIHNGADDNASGTAGLIEIARHFAEQPDKPRRRLVFIAFTGEERGLLGSARYVREPRFPLSKTVAMVNMDMIGRLQDDKLIVYGTGTAPEFDSLIDNLNAKYQFKITKKPGGFGPSDHSSFYAKQIPVFHIFTGTHADYHRPSDDFDKINVPGLERVTAFVTEIVASLASADARPGYVEIKRAEAIDNGGGDRPYFGSVPDFSQEVEGYALLGVAKDGPADKAGLKAGDVIIQFGTSKIGGLEDFDSALRKHKANEQVPVVVLRNGKPLTLTVTLDPPR